MLQIQNIDQETETLLSHLRALSNGETDEDPNLVSDFLLGLNYHDPDLFSFTEKGSLYNPVISNLVSLLMRVVGAASSSYAELLEALVRRSSFKELCVYCAPETILWAIENPSTRRIACNILCEKLNDGDDTDVVEFILSNDLIVSLSKMLIESQVPSCSNDKSGVVSDSVSVGKLIHIFTSKHPSLIPADRWNFLAEYPRDFVYASSSTYMAYLDALDRLASMNFDRLPSKGAAIFEFDKERFLQLPEELRGLNTSIVVNTYCHAIQELPFAWLRSFFHDFWDLATSGTQSISDDYFELFYKSVNMLLQVSGEPREFVMEYSKSHPHVSVFYNDDARFTPFFYHMPLVVIPDKVSFFFEHFGETDLSRTSSTVWKNAMHLISDKTFFLLLADTDKLCAKIIMAWPKDALYEFLVHMASYDYSAQYLLSQLPTVVSSSLLAVDRSVVNPGIWANKKDVLHRLLESTHVDLGTWRQAMSDCLYEMENGRRLRAIEPYVDVRNVAM